MDLFEVWVCGRCGGFRLNVPTHTCMQILSGLWVEGGGCRVWGVGCGLNVAAIRTCRY